MPSDGRNNYDWHEVVPGLNYMKSVDYRYRTWVNTVGYPLSSRKALPENSYSDSQRKTESYATRERSSYQGTITDQYALYGYVEGDPWYLHTYYPGNDLVAPNKAIMRTESSLLNEAKTKVLLRAADMKSNFAVSIAEAGKTGDLILSTARRIDTAYRALRRGNFKEVARQLNISPRHVHKTWLEYRYGWLPLLMDVKGSAELLAQHHLGRAENFVVSAKTSESKDYTYSAVTLAPNGTSVRKNSSATYTARVKLHCRIDNGFVSSLQQMGLVNPALVAWELTPYSFVFDWFISVGDWLTACSALSGITVIQAMSSISFVLDGNYGRVHNGYDFWGTWQFPASLGYTVKWRDYSRTPLGMSDLIVYPVVNDDIFNMKRVITSLALMRSSSSRLVRI